MFRSLPIIACSLALMLAPGSYAQEPSSFERVSGPPEFTGGDAPSSATAFALAHQEAVDFSRLHQPISTPIATVFPNPAQSFIVVSLVHPATEPLTISFVNMNGVVMLQDHFSAGFSRTAIDLSSLPSGYYSMQVQEQAKLPQATQILKSGD